MKKMIVENLKSIIVSLSLLVAALMGSYSGSFVASTLDPADVTIGALPGPDIYLPYLNVNGVTTHYRSVRGNTASTTICSIKSPAATTTLAFGSLQVNAGTTTAVAYELGKSTLFDATTTRIAYDDSVTGQTTITANVASTTQVASPNGVSYTDKQDTLIFAPNTYFNVKYGGIAVSSGASNGITNVSCKAEFIEN